MNAIDSERDVADLIHAAKALAVLAGCHEAGVFEALRAGPRRVEELPGDARALHVVLPVLSHLGLVVGDGERFALSSAGARLLSEGALPNRRHLDVLADHASMVAVLAEGGPVRDREGRSKGTTVGVYPDDRERTRAFLDMLYERSAQSAADTLAWTRGCVAPGGRVLDLGGGHGRYARAYADAGYAATLLDLPMVVELAEERHGDRMRYLGRDFRSADDLGGPYDLVLVSNVIHGQSEPENAALVARLARELAPGGALVLKDMFLDEHQQNPPTAVFFGLTMLFYTTEGRSYGVREAAAWCRAAGLDEPRMVILETHELVVATQPGARSASC